MHPSADDTYTFEISVAISVWLHCADESVRGHALAVNQCLEVVTA